MADGLDGLRALGMTEEELGVWTALAEVAGRMLALPQIHPMERTETVSEIHVLQNRLLARPGLRAQGWPEADGG
jgi:hypothetical protein